MSDVWRCVTVHCESDDETVMYVVDGEQEITRVNVKKGLPESHIAALQQNGFEVTIHDDDECPGDGNQ